MDDAGEEKNRERGKEGQVGCCLRKEGRVVGGQSMSIVFRIKGCRKGKGLLPFSLLLVRRFLFTTLSVLVPGHKYPKTGIKEIYDKTSERV